MYIIAQCRVNYNPIETGSLLLYSIVYKFTYYSMARQINFADKVWILHNFSFSLDEIRGRNFINKEKTEYKT